MNNNVITFEVVYDTQDTRGAIRRYRKNFDSAQSAKTYYERMLSNQRVMCIFCTAKIVDASKPKEKVVTRRIAQYYRK